MPYIQKAPSLDAIDGPRTPGLFYAVYPWM
jgi:hypothetical protein